MDLGVSLPKKNIILAFENFLQKQPTYYTIILLTYFIFKQEAGVGHIKAPSSFKLGVDRYGFFRADADTDYYRSSRPITDILNRYTCLV